MTTAVLDPFASAVEAGNRPDAFFGKMEVSAQYVQLVKGRGKLPWTESDSLDQRRTEINLLLNPLDCTGLTRNIERSVIAESREWSKVVWASLRDLGVKNPRDINGKWAHVELVPSGRKWTNKEGEEVQGTTFKFVAIFDTEAECTAAWEAMTGKAQEAHTPDTDESVPWSDNPPAAVSDAERNAALQFLPHIVNANKDDLTKLATALASMSPLNKFFTVASPEVQALLKAA